LAGVVDSARNSIAMKIPFFTALLLTIPFLVAAVTGPDNEKRFPPLKLPPGFEATLFACDPLVEYPSVIALGPRPGTLFVAHDYMTGLGREIVRRDEVRLLVDTDNDGYADTSNFYAGDFNSIQGLEFFNGEVFVMHAPFLTRLRDTDSDGVADERENLLKGLGLPPEENDVRLHCANGVTAGFDGWLYLAMGDHGVDLQRPEGDRLVLNGGGILRCRRDGTNLQIFATGTRNIYDVALDADLNVFIRDNENDGGSFKIRVSHSFFGANHGYPYLFREHPDELLKPLADLGLGSSAGGICYLETQFPAEYRGNLFFAEWGRSIVRYPLKPQGSSFAPTEEYEFTAGDESDAYPFKPTDVVVDRDGSLLISDWADGQRPNRGRARIYRISYKNAEPKPEPAQQLLARLDSESAHVRIAAQLEIEKSGVPLDFEKLGTQGRVHGVWILADDAETLFKIAENDSDARVRAQAVRALADLSDSNREIAPNLARLADGEDDLVVLREYVIAFGRARWDGLADWIAKRAGQADHAFTHSAAQALRRTENPEKTLKLLDLSGNSPIRKIALHALSEKAETVIANGLISRLAAESGPDRQRELAGLLTRIHRKAGPWVYWKYRPAPRLPNPVDWGRTEAIGSALNHVLASADFETRTVVLRQMRRENIPTDLAVLGKWLAADRNEINAATILRALADHPPAATRNMLEKTVGDTRYGTATRLTALRRLIETGTADFRKLAGTLGDDTVLAEVLLQMDKSSATLLFTKLDSHNPHVRAASIRMLGKFRETKSRKAALRLLDDSNPAVRAAAASAAGDLKITEAATQLLSFAKENSDLDLRRESLNALRKLGDRRAVSLAMLALSHPELRLTGLRVLGELGHADQGPDIVKRVAGSHDHNALQAAAKILDSWVAEAPEIEKQILDLHGQSGQLLRWKCLPVEDLNMAHAIAADPDKFQSAVSSLASGPNSTVMPGPAGIWVCIAELSASETTSAQFLASANGSLELWLNGRKIRSRETPAEFRPDSDRENADLNAGKNTVVAIVSSSEAARFHVRFRHRSSLAEQEELIQNVLGRNGEVEFGRELFFDIEVTLCALCHQHNGEGGRIGPDLSGAGSRFSRVYLIESILEPSRAFAPSFESQVVQLADGQSLLGVKVEEDAKSILFGDAAGQHHRVLKSDIQSMVEQPISIMPPGLENG
jgi:putative membrane-bound dehydrogenase-like protein